MNAVIEAPAPWSVGRLPLSRAQEHRSCAFGMIEGAPMRIPFVTRRDFAIQTASAFGAILPLGAIAAEQSSAAGPAMRVVCVGGHPDDPESGCGGTLARYIERGHHVTIIYLTRGEAGIRKKSHQEAAAIRTAEAEEACRILGAKPVFAGQIDGATEVNRERIHAIGALLAAERPDVILTHWPIDTHADHQSASFLTMQAQRMAAQQASLYFFEVDAGAQTTGFAPSVYVDITAVREKKKAALFAHRSQHGEAIYREDHEPMENFRGREIGVRAAEAFVSVARNSAHAGLPGLG
jgi:LmbE family N-acetylglucosaminyl deacetylase